MGEPVFPASEESLRRAQERTGLKLKAWQRDLLLGLSPLVPTGQEMRRTALAAIVSFLVEDYGRRQRGPLIESDRALPMGGPEDPRHGTAHGYQGLGCRCRRCKDANADATRRQVDARVSRPIPERVHGTDNGYSNYRCRCPRCKAARALAVANRKHTPQKEK